jgi:histone arginine demethylase JMJD6
MSEAYARSAPIYLEVPRREHLGRDEFVREYVLGNRPVIVTDAIREWRALSRWSPEFFKTEFGSVEVRVAGEGTTVGEVVDRILDPLAGSPAPYLHTTSPGAKMEHVLPALLADIQPLPELLAPNWLADRTFPRSLERRLQRGPQAELFLGGAGGRFSLHWDSLYFHVFAFQVYGQKLWYLYAPDQTPRLYPRAEVHTISEIDDVEHPDLDRFPLFGEAVCQRCTLSPGEMLFFPGGWWHTTRMHGPSISVSINTANASNWSQLAGELARKAGPLAPGVRAYFAAIKKYKSRAERVGGRAPD